MTENGDEEFHSNSSSVPYPSTRTPPRHSYSSTSLSEGGEGNLGLQPQNNRETNEEDEDENNYSESFEEESVVENNEKMNEGKDKDKVTSSQSQFKSPKIYESKIVLSSMHP
jgi:hypothetical protein